MDERIDPLAELERLIQSRTCEVCGDVWSDILPRYWKCRSEKMGGYTSNHWRNWRLCPNCLCKLSAIGFAGFDKFVFPVIQNMPDIQNLAEQLVAVQPMQLPAAQVFYMDMVVGPEGVRRHLPERHPLLRRYAAVDLAAPGADRTVRGRTRHVAMLDDANFRLDPA
jgi:hypothetical protein